MMMQVLSNGILKIADHQAVVNSNVLRQSIAAFYNPHPKSVVYPLDALTATSNRKSGGGRRFERYVYSEFYQRKMTKHVLDRQIKLSKGIRSEVYVRINDGGAHA